MDISLEMDMKSDPDIISLCANETIARDFYGAICNMRWRKNNVTSEDQKVINRLKGVDPTLWSCSWRSAGRIISEIRNSHHGKTECYMDFYSSGNEGDVTELVERSFNRLGWTKEPWPDNI